MTKIFRYASADQKITPDPDDGRHRVFVFDLKDDACVLDVILDFNEYASELEFKEYLRLRMKEIGKNYVEEMDSDKFTGDMNQFTAWLKVRIVRLVEERPTATMLS